MTSDRGDDEEAAERAEREAVGMVPLATGLVASMDEPDALPSWLTDADLDDDATEFARTGFTGGLNWYRTIDRTWQLTAPFTGAVVQQPAHDVAGARDVVLSFRGMDLLLQNLTRFAPKRRQPVILPGCVQWPQQERPSEMSQALVGFLQDLSISIRGGACGAARQRLVKRVPIGVGDPLAARADPLTDRPAPPCRGTSRPVRPPRRAPSAA